MSKGFCGKYPLTTVQITDAGRTAIDTHWARLEALERAAAEWSRSGSSVA